jgi:hypothetical protein
MAGSRPDSVCLAAVETARTAAADEAGDPALVGEPRGYLVEGERLLTHLFECRLPGYRDWQWAVTLTRVPRSRRPTVNDVVLIPGEESLVPPEWVPWAQRVEPDDLSPGAILPTDADDPRLVPGYEDLGAAAGALGEPREQVADLVGDLLLTRARMLSVAGQDEAAERWYDSDAGPQAEIAVAATKPCRTCGFVVPIAGPLGTSFGVCANGSAPDDGRVVSYSHGCGAHSQVAVPTQRPLQRPVLVYETEADLPF